MTIGCIRAGGRRETLKTIRGLLLANVNVWVLFQRTDDEERRIVSWRIGPVTDFNWRDRGKVGLEQLNLPTFVGDLRIRDDGRMASSVLDREDPDGSPYNRVFVRDYGRSTTAIRFEQLVASVTDLGGGAIRIPLVQAGDRVAVVDFIQESGLDGAGRFEFWPRDEDDAPFVEAEWSEFVRPPKPRPIDQDAFPPNSNMDAFRFTKGYRQAIATEDGAWGFLPIVDGVRRFGGFHDGESFQAFDFQPDLPAVQSGVAVLTTGYRMVRPLCRLGDDVRVECMIERVSSTPIYPNGFPAGTPREGRIYFSDRFVYDMVVRGASVLSATLIATERGEAYDSRPDLAPDVIIGVRYTRSGNVLTAAWVVGGEARQAEASANSYTNPNLLITTVVPLDDAERYSLVEYGGTWYMFDDANGYRTITDQQPFREWLIGSGQSAVRNDLRVSREFYDDFMEA